MYSITKQTNEHFGYVLLITREDSGSCKDPFSVYHLARKMKRLWSEECNNKIRILVDKQIMSLVELDKWAIDEYKRLPKCGSCALILNDLVHRHQLNKKELFCSQKCADKDYLYQLKKIEDEEESEFR